MNQERPNEAFAKQIVDRVMAVELDHVDATEAGLGWSYRPGARVPPGSRNHPQATLANRARRRSDGVSVGVLDGF